MPTRSRRSSWPPITLRTLNVPLVPAARANRRAQAGPSRKRLWRPGRPDSAGWRAAGGSPGGPALRCLAVCPASAQRRVLGGFAGFRAGAPQRRVCRQERRHEVGYKDKLDLEQSRQITARVLAAVAARCS